MNDKSTHKKFVQLLRKWSFFRLLNRGLWAVGWGLLVCGLLYAVSPLNWMGILGISLGCMGLVLWDFALDYRAKKPSSEKLATYLNQQYPALEDGSHLLLQDKEALPTLARLQRNKIAEKLSDLYPNIRVPQSLKRGSRFLIGCLGVSILLFLGRERLQNALLIPANAPEKTLNLFPTVADTISDAPKKQSPPTLLEQKITITSPSYTRLPKQTQETGNISIIEGAKITWTLHFDQTIDGCTFYLNESQKHAFTTSNQQDFTLHKTILANSFYHLSYQKGDFAQQSDYFTIKVQPDLPPIIQVKDAKNYTAIPFDTLALLHSEFEVKDDYGLSSVSLHTLLSRGSGENMVFSDSTIHYQPNGKTFQKQIRLSLKNLGIAPGDELYWYIAATDNKSPKAQSQRSNTYILAIEDTIPQSTMFADGLGIDKMPAYFRSQRQIIIDTEKLLKDAPTLDTETFKNRSNNIGLDQKILRLRYGKFLGEEFESHAGGDGDGHEGEHEGHEHHDNHDHDHDDQGDSDSVQIRTRHALSQRDYQDNSDLENEHAGHDHEGHEHHNHEHDHNHQGDSDSVQIRTRHALSQRDYRDNSDLEDGPEHHDHEAHNHNHDHQENPDSNLVRTRHALSQPDHRDNSDSENGHAGHDHEGHEHHNHEHDHDHQGDYDSDSVRIRTRHALSQLDSDSEHEHEGHEGHSHSNTTSKEMAIGGGEDLLAPYVHFHDSAEEATLFDQEIKTKLRAALNEMWQAELYLRTHEPKLALPYEYRALWLIKEVQQQSRIFVEQIGFDAPKLKMEKRLSGELDEVQNLDKETFIDATPKYTAIPKVIQAIEFTLYKKVILNKSGKETLLAASSELAALVLESGIPYLQTLKKMKTLSRVEAVVPSYFEDLRQIQAALLQIISAEQMPLQKQVQTHSHLERLYLREIGEL